MMVDFIQKILYESAPIALGVKNHLTKTGGFKYPKPPVSGQDLFLFSIWEKGFNEPISEKCDEEE